MDRGSVLSDKDVLSELEKHNIIIFPFSQDQLNSGSYNIKLGGYHYMALRDAYVPGTPAKQQFRLSPEEDITASLTGWVMDDPEDWRNKVVDIFPGLYGSEPSVEPLWSRCQTGDVILKPGDIALCHSEEFIGSLVGSITELRARSTLMRNCLSLAPSAGWGDVNFVNRWGFTIHNYGHRTIRLHPGDEIGQIVFHRIGDVLKPYNGSYVQKLESKLMNDKEHSEYCSRLVVSWEPVHLLSNVQRQAQSKLVFKDESLLKPQLEIPLVSSSSSSTSRESKDVHMKEEVVIVDEYTRTVDDIQKTLKSIKSRMLRTMNPKIAIRTDKRKAVQNAHIMIDSLGAAILQSYTRTNFDLVQDSRWRTQVLENVREVVFTWVVTKFDVERHALERIYEDYCNDRNRSLYVDRNLEHQMSQLYHEERDKQM